MMKAATSVLAALLILPAHAQEAPAEGVAKATLTVRQGGTRGADGIYTGGSFVPVESFEPPADHWRSDLLIAFEGPGWESDRVGYRLYLDERNVPDIYGKKLPAPVLGKIGQGKDDYHDMADWGQDIFQVDASLGMGGIGVLREGKASQIGKSRISARTGSWEGSAFVRVDSKGFAGAGGPADLIATYAIAPGSRVTYVHASVGGTVPQMVAGLRHHAGTEAIRSAQEGAWRYIATWGKQSLTKDNLGIVLFYRADQTSGDGDDGMTWYVRFTETADIRYAFAAAWEQEPGAPGTLAAFKAWLDEMDAELEADEE